MDETKIRVAQSNEIGKIAAMMTVAFSGDPFMRWMYPEPDAFIAHFPKFVEAFAGGAFDQNAAFVDKDLVVSMAERYGLSLTRDYRHPVPWRILGDRYIFNMNVFFRHQL